MAFYFVNEYKPENLMLVHDRDGEHLVLLDFGAARTYLSNETKTMTSVVTHGFSPLEQYSRVSRQGSFTDVYALCATMYNAITGQILPSANERNIDGIPIKSISEYGISVDPKTEAAIMHSLALRSSDRTQTMEQLLEELGEEPDPVDERKQIFLNACILQREAKTADEYRAAIATFQSIADYPGAKEHIRQCEESIHRLKEEEGRKKKPIILAVCAAVAVLVFCIMFFSGRNDKDEDETAETAIISSEPVVSTPTSSPTTSSAQDSAPASLSSNETLEEKNDSSAGASYTDENGIRYIIFDGHAEVDRYNVIKETSISIPSSVEGKPVTVIGEDAFLWCDSVESVTIPDSITTIRHMAFGACESLANVTLPESITTIEDDAFEACNSFINFRIPSGVTKLSGNPAGSCDNLKSFSVDSGNTVYTEEDGILYSIDKTTLIAFPAGRQETAFSIPYGVTTVGVGAFRGCDNLTSIIIPSSVKTIESNAFSGSQSLKDIAIPESVRTIGDYAFRGCFAFTDFTVPGSINTIGDYAFSYCTSLTNITIAEGVTEIGMVVFYNCDSLTSIVIPRSVTEIGYRPFLACKNLTDIYYAGTEEEWINIAPDDIGTEALVHFNY